MSDSRVATSVRIVIVDDHEDARLGIQTILEAEPTFEVVGLAASGEDALRLVAELSPDLVLMDINLPGMDGLEATKRVKELAPETKVVMATVSDDVAHLFEAIKRGAQGYVLKNLQPSAWLEYLRAVASDEVPLSKELATRILREFGAASPPAVTSPDAPPSRPPLTARETEVLRLVAKGRSNRAVSEELHLSEHTVKNHLKSILHKLQLQNRVQLARLAAERGWVREE
ncbi:response regulator transcription factor [Paenibacillus sp.]|uniref:response regulator transcription factor n=1 Tax=Paenibacillus sp. TaxID=58172 RepID=UPI0028127C55|nr:response regulator transcription factor [Paenibacillus sp.]